MAAIFKSSLQNLLLQTSLKVEPLAKPKTGLKFFVNTTKPKTKVLAVLGQKLETKISTLSLSPGPVFMKGLSQGLGFKLRLLSGGEHEKYSPAYMYQYLGQIYCIVDDK